jgi:hypothetical protein
MANVHAQLGASFGRLFSTEHSHLLRFAIGYYNGVDPRAKYSQYAGKRESFGYFSAMFNL